MTVVYSPRAPRVVDDVLTLGDAPVAFDQVGEEVGCYQPVCPWCAEDIGDRIHASTYGQLYEALYKRIVPHIMESPCSFKSEQSVVAPRRVPPPF